MDEEDKTMKLKVGSEMGRPRTGRWGRETRNCLHLYFLFLDKRAARYSYPVPSLAWGQRRVSSHEFRKEQASWPHWSQCPLCSVCFYAW